MDKFKNKYRIKSIRHPSWDYASNASYFITICTQNKECFFGEIKNDKMYLSEIGIIAVKCWYEIPKHFPFVILGSFVVMPNHIHGIIIINKINNPSISKKDINYKEEEHKNKFGPQSKNLASIVRGYKIGVSKISKKINPLWQWQSRFHEHIIRNEKAYHNISNYINHNPVNWNKDKFK